MTENNPLTIPFDTPFGVPPFDKIKTEHYVPGIKKNIGEAKLEIEAIANNEAAPTFTNTIEALELAGDQLGLSTSVLFNLNSAETSDEIQKIAMELSPELTAFQNDIMQNEALFSRVKSIYDESAQLDLTTEQRTLLEKTYKGFVRSGADLDARSKQRYREISTELAELTLKFGENVLAETNKYELLIEDEEDLAGLPKYAKDAAAHLAESKKKKGWMFTLQAPSYIPFMEHADNRDLRERLFKAYMSKCVKGDDLDNQNNIRKIISLRSEMANLLGYESYATYILEERMAKTVAGVEELQEELMVKSMGKAKEEVEEIKSFMRERGDDFELQRWDWAYYSEKLKKKKFNISDELLKPYFQLDKCINGVFAVAAKLYGLSFKFNTDIPVYHEDVKGYEVYDESNKLMAIFYADFFPREGKRGGAWMTNFREQRVADGHERRPVVSIVCNFTPPSGETPSLLTFDEVNTLFHEFGHALHSILAEGSYSSISGTNVYWDFVELPSQILENWLLEKECLDLFAEHYETGEPIPQELIDNIKSASKYHQAYQTMRQLSFGMLDMKWHTVDSLEEVKDVQKFEQEAFRQTDLFPPVAEACMSTQFSHIFAGGYGAGYYSYKWAEVLDADAFAYFKEKGIFNKEVAQSFRNNILSKGGSEHPMELYKRFRGKEPSIEALLERSGLK
ncbi:MAG: M3 family metallopeptidase [Cyclobacteriaceae bacterium]